jgi:hypothetical protein
MSVSISSTEAPPRARVPEEIPLPWLFRPVLALPGPSLGIGAAAVLLAVFLDLAWFNASGLWQGFSTEGVPYWRHPLASLNVAYELGFGFSALALIQLVRGADVTCGSSPRRSSPDRSRRCGARSSASPSAPSGWEPRSGSRS